MAACFPNRTTRRLRLLMLALCVGVALQAHAVRAQTPSAGGAVFCLDPGRSTVRVTPSGQCPGRVISAAEAERIQGARDARTQRIVGQERGGASRALPGALRRGSGFFINAEGMLLTNRHVVDRCRAISITTADGRTTDAQLRAFAEHDDIALLATRTAPAAFARFSSTPDATSDALVIVGYPRGSPTPRVATLSSASRSTVDLMLRRPFYAVPGVAQPGHSGSPLLDQAGNVVGIVVARITARRTVPDASEQRSFVGAIPIATVTAFLARNRIGYQTAPAAEEWTDRELLDRARQFVAQVSCLS